MFNKELLVSALVLTFSFGFIGTAMAGSVTFDEKQIENFVQAEAGNNEVTYVRNYAPAGAISNLDTTTAGLDAELYVIESAESKSVAYVQCYSPAGVISNLDTTTAELDAKVRC